MIYGFAGQMRHGKGVGATLFAYEYATLGYKWISNMYFFMSNNQEKKTSLDLDLDILEKAIDNAQPLNKYYPSYDKIGLCLDEITTIADNRVSLSKENRLFGYLAGQSAKRNMPIIHTAQLSDAADLRVRRNTHYLIKSEKLYVKINENNQEVNYILGFDYDIVDLQPVEPTYYGSRQLTAGTAAQIMTMFNTEQSIPPTRPITRQKGLVDKQAN